MKIIVLTITQYKEKDGIIFALSEEGVVNYTARGMFDPKNKNAGLNNPLTIADVELGSDRYKYPIIKSSNILFSPLKVNNDFYYLGSISFLAEVTKKLMQEDEMAVMYKHLYNAIDALKKAKEPWMVILIYLFNVFKVTGYEFQVTECLFCGTRKNIATFSIKDGGFVCNNCLHSDTERVFSNEQMLLIRSAYLASNYKVESPYCTKENALFLLEKFHEFIQESFGVTINSICFLNK